MRISFTQFRLHAGLALLLSCLCSGVSMAAPLTIKVTTKPGQPWKEMPTRTLGDLPAVGIDSALTPYGGWADRQIKATGFFYTTKLNGRWWLVDPSGALFFNRAVVSVAPLPTPKAQAALTAKFGNVSQWASRTTADLRALGFNGLGAWSDTDRLSTVPQPLAYTRIWNFMASYGKKRGGTFVQAGHTGYPNDCIFVFDPEFETFCDEHAKQLIAGKNDPHLLGHFSDNELPFKSGALARYLALPSNDAGHQAARQWLQSKHGANAQAPSITELDESEFLEFMVARYFRIVAAAIKKHDPNHLFLGSRFHGKALAQPEIFRAAGKSVDVVSVNYYNAWTPDATRLTRWEHEAQKPILITEWYVKAEDSGMGNTSGAGWLVKTQGERGAFYENFTLGLLESKVCVGWHWFKYIDNDPENKKADPSNLDSNKGIMNNRYEPYAPLQESMQRINERTYALIEYLDTTPKTVRP